MSQINLTRDAGTGTGTVWDIRGTTGMAGRGAPEGLPAATFTFTSSVWGVPVDTSAVRESAAAGMATPRRASLAERIMERKLAQWTAAYLAGAWLVLQLIDVLADIWALSTLVQQLVSLVLGLGIMPALVVAWYHGEKGRQEVCSTECALMAASIMASVSAIWMFCLAAIA